MKKNGFTLIEVLMAIILVGIAIASLLAANSSFTKTTGAGTELSTAEFLIEQIRELTTLANYDDLDDFDGAVFSPPINANREPLNDFAAYRQQITVEKVSNTNFQQVVSHDDNESRFVRVTVRAILNGREISSTSWIRARY